MKVLEITAIVPGPRVFADGTDPSTGAAVRTAAYSGYVALARGNQFRGIVQAHDMQSVSFFLPDSLPYPQPPASLGVQVGLRRFLSSTNIHLVHFGACQERIEVAADPRGGEHQWLRLSFQVPVHSNDLLEINYHVITQSSPVD